MEKKILRKIALIGAGLSMKTLAEEYGCSRASVTNFISGLRKSKKFEAFMETKLEGWNDLNVEGNGENPPCFETVSAQLDAGKRDKRPAPGRRGRKERADVVH